MDLIASTDRGLYCAAGDFYIDPWRPVPRAIITHAHSDHARFGSDVYVCHRDTAPILRKRLGDVTIETATYGQILRRNGVELSFHPAGHMLGSAQVRVAWKGETWVASGDYKLESDGVSPAFEPLRCHAFITESTFGLPIYRWRPQIVQTVRKLRGTLRGARFSRPTTVQSRKNRENSLSARPFGASHRVFARSAQ